MAYPDHVWDRVLELVAEGLSVAEAAREPEMPEKETIWRRIYCNPEYRERFYDAERLRATAKMDEAYDIVDERPGATSGDTQRDALRVNTRIKIAERLLERYSTRVTAVTEDSDGKKPLGVIAVPTKVLRRPQGVGDGD